MKIMLIVINHMSDMCFADFIVFGGAGVVFFFFLPSFLWFFAHHNSANDLTAARDFPRFQCGDREALIWMLTLLT